MLWQIFNATYGANFHCRKWPNIEKVTLPSGHTAFDAHNVGVDVCLVRKTLFK